MPEETPKFERGEPEQFGNFGGLASVTVKRRKLPLFLVQESELDILEEGYSSLDFGFFGIFLGAAVTLVVAALTNIKTMSSLIQVGFWITAGFCAFLAWYFIRQHLKTKDKVDKKLKKIRSEDEIAADLEFTLTQKTQAPTPFKP